MLDTIKILTDVTSINVYSTLDAAVLRKDSNMTLYFQLWQTDRGARYIPETGSTLTVKFLRMQTIAQTPSNQDVTKTADAVYSDDRSMWKVTLTAANVNNIVGGGIQLTLVEPISTTTTVLFVPEKIQKVSSSGASV